MFPFWTSPDQPRKLLTDDELESSKKNDDYIYRKRILNTLSLAVVLIIIFIVAYAGFMVYSDVAFRQDIANMIKSEFKTIFYSVLAIFGVRTLDKKN